MKVRINPPYKKIKQKPYLCGPACLEMVLKRHGRTLPEQEVIAFELGTRLGKLKKKESREFRLKFRVDEKDYGINLQEFNEEKVQEFIDKYSLPFEIRAYKISRIKNFEKFILDNIILNNDIMMNIWLEPIFKKSRFGHYVLVSQIDTEKHRLTVCDPSPKGKDSWKVKIDKVKEAMGKKWDGNERGVVIIKKAK